MSLAGDGLPARARTAWFGALGVGTAVGLGLVAFALNHGWPSFQELPFPSGPPVAGEARRAPTSETGAVGLVRRPREGGSSTGRADPVDSPDPQRIAGTNVVESRQVAVAPPPEPAPAPPPPRSEPDPSPQPQSASPPPVTSPPTPSSQPSAPSAESASAPKGKGVGLTRAPGQTKSKPAGAKPESLPTPATPPTVPVSGPGNSGHARKHAGKSDGGR